VDDGTWKTAYNLYPGVGNCGNTNGVCVPRLENTTSAWFEIDDWTFNWRAHFIRGLNDIQTVQPNFLNYTGPGNYLMHDARVSYDINENVRATFGVNNVFGEDPPYVFNTGNNTNPYLYSEAVIGRYYFMRVKAKL